MGNILNVEHVGQYSRVIDIYAKNKVGQYSKFLGSNPTFVTYYHRNMVQSRQDVGTGSIESEIGDRSPIRFIKILNLPVYNLPVLNPMLNYDDEGYDIDLDISDAVLLPNTVKPYEGDYFIVKLPGTREFLFRVNSFQYNTIQSNDFYKFDADVRAVGHNLEKSRKIDTQVVETLFTVFDNIGTEDRCFLKSEDASYLDSLADLYNKLREYYRGAFYVRNVNTFLLHTGRWSETAREILRTDPYLEKFITESNIYYDENVEESLVMSPADTLPDDFRFTFSFTIYDAILKRSIELLRPYEYLVTKVITAPTSIFNVEGYFGEFAQVYCYKQPISVDTSEHDCPCCIVPVVGSGQQWYDLNPMPKCTPTWDLSDGKEYFPSRFLLDILCKKGDQFSIDTDDYFELIIFNYLHHINMKYDRAEIINALDKDEHTFYYLPLVIYILGTAYKDYFVSEKEIESK